MAITTAAQKITQLYVAYFDRAPDPAGLNYWVGRFNAGMDLEAIAESFSEQPEATSTYNFLQFSNIGDPSAFITSVYQNMFGRAPDAEGQAYWEGQLSSGAIPVGQMIVAIANGARNVEGGTQDLAVLENKVEVGTYYANSFLDKTWTASANAAGAASVMDSVTSDAATVTAAKTTVDTLASDAGTGTVGQTFTLTTGIDSFSGTANNDTFLGDDKTVTSTDQIDGAAGTDMLKVYDTGTNNVVLPTLTNVESVWVNDLGNALNVSSASAVKTVELDSLDTAITLTAGADQTVVLDSTNVNGDTTVAYASTVTAANVQVDDFDSDAGGDDDLVFTGTGLTSITLEALNNKSTITNLDTDANATTLNLKATSAALTITESDEGADDKVTTINVTGSKAAEITNALSTAVTKIDASASTGGFTTTLAGLAAAATFTGGSGGDKLTAINTNANTIDMGAGDDTVDLNAVVASDSTTVKGGEGTDTLVFGDASATLITSSNKAAFTGFETMKAEVSTDTLDFEALSTFTNLELGASTAATVNNISTSAAGAILVSGDQTTSTILNIKDATTVGQTNSMKLTLDHETKETDVDVSDLQSDGLETLEIVSTGTKASDGTTATQNSVEIGTETNDLTKVTITGDSDFTLTVDGGGDISGQQTIDGSAATGKLSIDWSGDTDGVSITGGTNDDTIVAGSGNDILVGGAGKDNITAGDGTATITLGDGADTITILDADFINANKLTVTDFAAGTDKIDINDSTNLVTGGGGNIVGGMSTAELQTASAASTSYTAGGGAVALELAFEFDADVDLDTATKADILSAVGAADNSASSSKTAGTITAAAADDDLMLIAYQDGNAYLFRAQAGGGDTAIGDGTGAGDAIDLVGVLQNVAVGALSANDFI